VNYLFIFDMNPQDKVTHVQLYRISVSLFSFWFACAVGHLLMVRLSWVFHHKVAYFPLICFLVFLIVFVNPFHIFYRKMRLEIFKTLCMIAAAPFGPVRFRHFFLADVLTSMVKPIQDLSFIGCFFFSTAWVESEEPICAPTQTINFALAFVPYWFRFAQCLRKFHDTSLKLHLLNALKYFSCILVQLANIYKEEDDTSFALFTTIYFLSTLYCCFWDFYFDWGLMRTVAPGKWGLRDKLLYPRFIYYYAMVTNLGLRFLWIFSLTPKNNFSHWFNDFGVMIFILSIAEAYRRC